MTELMHTLKELSDWCAVNGMRVPNSVKAEIRLHGYLQMINITLGQPSEIPCPVCGSMFWVEDGTPHEGHVICLDCSKACS